MYETLFEQIKTVPQEYLADIENYVGYILYRNQQPRRKRRGIKPSARIIAVTPPNASAMRFVHPFYPSFYICNRTQNMIP